MNFASAISIRHVFLTFNDQTYRIKNVDVLDLQDILDSVKEEAQ